MEGREIILHFEGKTGFLTPNRKISLIDLGLSGMLASFKHPAYWVIRIVKAFPPQGRLFVEVKSYHSEFRAVSDEQLNDSELLKYGVIDFKNLDTSGVFASNNTSGSKTFISKPEQQVERLANRSTPQVFSEPRTPIHYSFSEQFIVDFSDTTFEDGKVTFEVYSRMIKMPIVLSVSNNHILPEYNHVKSWFPKRLGKSGFTVSATLEVINNSIVSYQCTSPEIARITPEMITAIMCQRITNLTSAPKIQTDRSLFMLDEAFKEVATSDTAGNIFQQQDIDVVNQLLDQSNIRNKRELQYLSEKLHSTKQPLRYTLAPQFGFLFCVHGISANHFIWELLDSHATYIWTLSQTDLPSDLEFQIIDREIGMIRVKGRQEYRAGVRNASFSTVPFKAIHHKSKDSEASDNFLQWKEELEQHLQ